jgi:ferredoxin, 2Fe-2S
MVRITFVDRDGNSFPVNAIPGRSLMQAVGDASLPLLIGECGGSCNCASCHAYLETRYLPRLPPVSRNEANMLDAIWNSRHNSRLTCQIVIGEELEGLVVSLPKEQA